MAGLPSPAFWRGCRVAFRLGRLLAWCLILLVLGTLLYLDRVGLPELFRQPLLKQVRQHGLELEYARLRLRLFSGLLADHVALRPVAATNAPRLQAEHVRLDLNTTALLQGRWELEGLEIVRGRLAPFSAWAPAEQTRWTVEQIQARVRFLHPDTWHLEQLQAQVGPIQCSFTATLTNAQALRQWPGLDRRELADKPSASLDWPAWTRWLERLQFSGQPELVGHLEGDAQHAADLNLALQFRVPEVVTPWGTYHGLQASLRTRPGPIPSPLVQLKLTLDRAWTPWGDAVQLHATLDLSRNAENGDPRWLAEIAATAQSLRSQGVALHGNRADIGIAFAPSHRVPDQIQVAFRCDELDAGNLTGQAVRLQAQLQASVENPALRLSPGPWQAWTHWRATGTVSAQALQAETLHLSQVRATISWSAPALQLEPFEARLASGSVQGALRLDTASHQTHFEFQSDADPREVEPFLSERARRWLGQFQWSQPPRVQAGGTLHFPDWPPRSGGWAQAFRSSLTMTGQVALVQGSFRGFEGQRAHAHFRFSNETWHLVDLEVIRRDGWVRADYQVRPWARDYRWRFAAQLPPDAVLPLLQSNTGALLQHLRWTEPPHVEGEVWGEFLRPDTVAGQGRIEWHNFTFRGVPVSRLTTYVAFSNRWLHAIQPRVERNGAVLSADGLAVDFHSQRVHLTNAIGRDDPATVAAAIGPKTATNLAPYQFEQPPWVQLDGTIPWHGTDGANLQVKIKGGPFRWWRFRSPHLTGALQWSEHLVILTNVAAEFYGGRLEGWGVFDFSPARGVDCRFQVQLTQVQMAALMQDVSPSPRPLEGLLDGRLAITEGNSGDWRSWNGQGEVRLRDGWIWSIPLFGILSEPLDALVPGLGRSPVTSARATFVLTNGVIVTDNLECRAPTMRLIYSGRAQLDGQVDAVVQAELLRDAWLVGRVLSLALWPVSKIFEFRVTGTLSNPKAEPLHIPRVLTIPLRPVQTLRELFRASPQPLPP